MLFLDFSVGIGEFVIGLSQISSFFLFLLQLTGLISSIFCNSCFINVHIDDEKNICIPGKLAYKRSNYLSCIMLLLTESLIFC